MSLDLVCLGNLTIDDIVMPDGETSMGCFGGDAVYASLAAAFWTSNVQFVAPEGSGFPISLIKSLEQSGLDTNHLPKRPVPSIRNWVLFQQHSVGLVFLWYL